MKGEATSCQAYTGPTYPRLPLPAAFQPSLTEAKRRSTSGSSPSTAVSEIPSQPVPACLLSPDEQDRAETLPTSASPRPLHRHPRSPPPNPRLATSTCPPKPCTSNSLRPPGQASPDRSARSTHHLTFNLSHSADLAACWPSPDTRSASASTWSTARANETSTQIASRNFSRTEAAAIASLPEDRRTEAFYACWTLKEAYLKATGDGLSYSTRQLRSPLSPGRVPHPSPHPRG